MSCCSATRHTPPQAKSLMSVVAVMFSYAHLYLTMAGNTFRKSNKISVENDPYL